MVVPERAAPLAWPGVTPRATSAFGIARLLESVAAWFTRQCAAPPRRQSRHCQLLHCRGVGEGLSLDCAISAARQGIGVGARLTCSHGHSTRYSGRSWDVAGPLAVRATPAIACSGPGRKGLGVSGSSGAKAAAAKVSVPETAAASAVPASAGDVCGPWNSAQLATPCRYRARICRLLPPHGSAGGCCWPPRACWPGCSGPRHGPLRQRQR